MINRSSFLYRNALSYFSAASTPYSIDTTDEEIDGFISIDAEDNEPSSSANLPSHTPDAQGTTPDLSNTSEPLHTDSKVDALNPEQTTLFDRKVVLDLLTALAKVGSPIICPLVLNSIKPAGNVVLTQGLCLTIPPLAPIAPLISAFFISNAYEESLSLLDNWLTSGDEKSNSTCGTQEKTASPKGEISLLTHMSGNFVAHYLTPYLRQGMSSCISNAITYCSRSPILNQIGSNVLVQLFNMKFNLKETSYDIGKKAFQCIEEGFAYAKNSCSEYLCSIAKYLQKQAIDQLDEGITRLDKNLTELLT
jgi:hypothetical protein